MAESNRNLYILLAILIFAIVGLVIVVIIYRYVLGPTDNETVICTADNQCSPGSTCVSGVCTDINCTSDLDCSGSQICLGIYCVEKSCKDNSDCSATGEACSGGFCVPYGGSCTTSLDCNNSSIGCVSGICQQCSTNTDCKNGFCNNGLCENSCSGLCSSGQVCVQNKIETCCDSADSNCGKACSSSNSNNSSCKYCINGMYTCKQGETFEQCTQGSDCVSGTCLIGTTMGNVCSYVSYQQCVSNYDPTSNLPGSCTSGLPYCSEGSCSTSPLGAPCGTNNSCRTESLNTPVVTPTTTAPAITYSYYCVNNFCNINPGTYGDSCLVSDDCGYATATTNSTPSSLQCINNVCM